jgi:Ca2+-binding EF-hand superfamily protein
MTLNDVFRLLDKDSKGYLNIYDIEDIIMEHKRTRSSELMNEVELILSKYDRSGNRRISYLEFIDELTPKQ